MKKNILIVGDGGWGTAVALLLHHNKHNVRIWGKFPDYIEYLRNSRENAKFLPGIKIPEEIEFLADIDIALKDIDIIVLAVPTQYIRGVLEELKTKNLKIPIVSLAKGIEQKTLKRPSQIIHEVLAYPKNRIAVLSGPSHAEEVARGKPASVVIASGNKRLAQELQSVFKNEYFRVYTQNDVVGVELAAAVKNIIAIAAGICYGLELGDNTIAALLTRGIVEITRFGRAMGGKQATFHGLAGIGDLITTCVSTHGRNRAVGVRLGKGETLAQILGSMQMVAEGVWTTKGVVALSKKYKVEMPITNEVFNILFKNKKPMEAIYKLMTRKSKSE